MKKLAYVIGGEARLVSQAFEQNEIYKQLCKEYDVSVYIVGLNFLNGTRIMLITDGPEQKDTILQEVNIFIKQKKILFLNTVYINLRLLT